MKLRKGIKLPKLKKGDMVMTKKFWIGKTLITIFRPYKGKK